MFIGNLSFDSVFHSHWIISHLCVCVLIQWTKSISSNFSLPPKVLLHAIFWLFFTLFRFGWTSKTFCAIYLLCWFLSMRCLLCFVFTFVSPVVCDIPLCMSFVVHSFIFGLDANVKTTQFINTHHYSHGKCKHTHFFFMDYNFQRNIQHTNEPNRICSAEKNHCMLDALLQKKNSFSTAFKRLLFLVDNILIHSFFFLDLNFLTFVTTRVFWHSICEWHKYIYISIHFVK